MDFPADLSGIKPVDVLAIGVHPDDVELGCSGSLLKLIAAGKSVAILDLTQGELGTRGTADQRLIEARAAADVLGVDQRVNLGLRDGWFGLSEVEVREVVRMLRAFRPKIIFANAPEDRHPDHGRAAQLVHTAGFLSGLRRIETHDGTQHQDIWRPPHVYQYIQDRLLQPQFVLDISAHFAAKLEAIRAFRSQFYDPQTDADEPETYISSERFWHSIEARARQMGQFIGTEYGEGFVATGPLRLELPPGL